jgi:P27 family predicted phage terminase small subunit
MSGPRPKPTFLKLIEGNPGKRPLSKREPKPQGLLTTAPAWLTPSQQLHWQHAIDSAPIGLLTKLDMQMLAVWVVAADLYQRAVEQQAALDRRNKTTSLLSRTPNGSVQQSPYLPIINKQAMIMIKAAAEMGFSPAARTRIEMPDPEDSARGDKASKYLT